MLALLWWFERMEEVVVEILEDLRGETALCPALLAPEMRRGCVVERLWPFMSSELQGRQPAHRVRKGGNNAGVNECQRILRKKKKSGGWGQQMDK